MWMIIQKNDSNKDSNFYFVFLLIPMCCVCQYINLFFICQSLSLYPLHTNFMLEIKDMKDASLFVFLFPKILFYMCLTSLTLP